MCVCERGKKRECVTVILREVESMCVYVCVFVCKREREKEGERVCLGVRERVCVFLCVCECKRVLCCHAPPKYKKVCSVRPWKHFDCRL